MTLTDTSPVATLTPPFARPRMTVTGPRVDGTDLVLDLSQLGFVDSSGLRVLISAQHQLADHGGTLVLRSPSETVRRLLEITGLVDHITISDG